MPGRATLPTESGSLFRNVRTERCKYAVHAKEEPPPTDICTEQSDDVVAVAPRPHRGVREVYLGGPSAAFEVEYFVEMPESSGSYTFGPAQVRTPAATEWADVPDTSTEVLVVSGAL